MRILYLTQFFSSTRGGAPLIFYDLGKALSKRGHKVYIICNVATETIETENVKVYTVKPLLCNTYELPPSPKQNLRYIANSVVLGAKVARKHKIELIHTNSFTPVIAGSILSKIKRTPMIASIYDVFTNKDSSNWRNWAHYNNLPRYYSTIGRVYEQISLRMPFRFIHTISQTTKEDILLHKTDRPIRVIYPAIDVTMYRTVQPSYDNFILYIGRLVFYKNVDVIIRAYEEVIKELPTAKLIVVGEGPMEDEWRNLAQSVGVSNNVLFTGHVSHQDKIDLLSRCSALALPSIFEGFGLVVLEAFAMQKPVLAANIPPLDEIVDQDINGFLLSFNDAHQWATAIIALLTNQQLCHKMGYNGAKKVTDKFDFTKYIKSMESLYMEAIASSRKPRK
jgi:glycosyltransferase involved in cell wall biosynthesis